MDKLGKIELHNCDCMELLKNTPDNFYDLAIVDPPYGININESIGRRKGDKHSGRKKALWDNSSPSKKYFDELIRVSKNQIIFGANHFISKIPYDSSCWIMWDKKFSECVSFSQFELAWTSFNTTCKKFDKSPTNGCIKFHPTEKPISLYKWLLNNYAKKGDKILDTHFGSLSIGIACHDMDFELTACELDRDYYEMAKNRLAQHQQQQIFNFEDEIYVLEPAQPILFDEVQTEPDHNETK